MAKGVTAIQAVVRSLPMYQERRVYRQKIHERGGKLTERYFQKTSNPLLFSLYPLGWSCIHFQADPIISDNASCSGFQPSSVRAFSASATKWEGSPALRGSSFALISRPVTSLADLMTSKTE